MALRGNCARRNPSRRGAKSFSVADRFKQPISQAEIDRLFDVDKRGLVVKLRELKLVEEFTGPDGRLHFATTETFLQRFGLASLGDGERTRQP